MSVSLPTGRCHRPARRWRVPVDHATRGWLGGLAILAAPLLGGCAMSFPMGSLLPASDDVTGSLAQVPFGQLLEEEDRRREKAALATALDPQGEGSAIHWENAKTGNRGTITPVGQAYASESKICRAFVSDLKHEGGTRTVQGTACTIAAGDWIVKETKPFSKV